MHGKLGLLSPGGIEQPYYGATQLFYFIFLLCAVFPCFHTTGCEAYSFTTDGYGIFLTCAPIFVHACAHTKAGQALMSALTRVDSEELKNGPSHPASTGDWTHTTGLQCSVWPTGHEPWPHDLTVGSEDLYIYLLKAYSPVNWTGSPQGFSLKRNLEGSQ